MTNLHPLTDLHIALQSIGKSVGYLSEDVNEKERKELTIDSVDQAIGQVIIGLSSASKASEGLGVSILGVLGRALELTRVTFQVPATFLIKGGAGK